VVTHTRGVLDTSAVILLSRLVDSEGLPREAVITAITLAELAVGPLATTDVREQARRQVRLQQAESDFEALPFDAAAARSFATVAASLRRKGRKPSARAFDALIAATALSRELPVYTANPDDFDGIDDLEVVAVLHPTPPVRAS
jgi:tRNA(fMet)-specific endonuclease VapC